MESANFRGPAHWDWRLSSWEIHVRKNPVNESGTPKGERGRPMFQIVKYETFNDRQVIFKEGTFGDWMYVIEEGAVEISRVVEGKKIVIAVLKTGEIIGEVAYISKEGRSATATAVGKTRIGMIDREYFDRELNGISSDFQMILKSMARRLRETTDHLIQLQNQAGK
jgi:CRP-like cAMP-binding protein